MHSAHVTQAAPSADINGTALTLGKPIDWLFKSQRQQDVGRGLHCGSLGLCPDLSAAHATRLDFDFYSEASDGWGGIHVQTAGPTKIGTAVHPPTALSTLATSL